MRIALVIPGFQSDSAGGAFLRSNLARNCPNWSILVFRLRYPQRQDDIRWPVLMSIR